MQHMTEWLPDVIGESPCHACLVRGRFYISFVRDRAQKGRALSYRAIIADDEPKIIQLIRLLGKWEAYDIEIVDECHDGRAALESIKKHSPDLVLSDIKMPDLDGLELIRQTRNAGINSLFILLSGYRHFEYAKSAIALNVVDYLLKPIDEEQLNETLEKVCLQIEQRRELEYLKKLETEQEKQKVSLFWHMLLLENEEERKKWLSSLSVCNKKFGTGFQEGCFQIISTVTGLNAMMEHQDSMLSDKVDSFLKHIFESNALYYDYSTYKGRLIVLNFQEKNKVQVKDAIVALFYQIRDLRGIYGDFQINFGCSSVKKTISEMHNAYLEAEAAQWGRLIFVGNNIIEYDQVAGLTHFPLDSFLNEEELNRLCDSIRYLNRETVAELFAELNKRSAGMRHVYPGDLWQCFIYMMLGVLNVLPEKKHRDRMEEKFYYAYVESRNFQQVIKNVYIALDDYLSEAERKLREKLGKPMGEAVRFMKENYSKPISMEDIADAAGVSTGYLSKLFKRELDMGVNEYLTRIRLEKSQELLAETSMSVKEIALMVGYPDEKYYSRLFKKTTGIKPTDYRKLYGG